TASGSVKGGTVILLIRRTNDIGRQEAPDVVGLPHLEIDSDDLPSDLYSVIRVEVGSERPDARLRAVRAVPEDRDELVPYLRERGLILDVDVRVLPCRVEEKLAYPASLGVGQEPLHRGPVLPIAGDALLAVKVDQRPALVLDEPPDLLLLRAQAVAVLRGPLLRDAHVAGDLPRSAHHRRRSSKLASKTSVPSAP